MNPSAADKSRFERLLDAGLYAPLGYALRRDEVREDLAAAGRKQVAFARSLGRAALKGMGRGIRPSTDSQAPARTEEEPTGDVDSSVAPTTPEPAVTTAEIDGYADMTAKEIIALVASASLERAQWIIAEEGIGKQRITVIRAANARIDRDG